MTFNTIEVWNIKSQNKEMAYIVADEFTNETVNSLMQYIKRIFLRNTQNIMKMFYVMLF